MSENNHQIGGDHYTSKQVQPWDAMEAWMSREEFGGYLRGNIIRYICRYKDKHKDNPVQDLQKAKHYLGKLIEHELQSKK